MCRIWADRWPDSRDRIYQFRTFPRKLIEAAPCRSDSHFCGLKVNKWICCVRSMVCWVNGLHVRPLTWYIAFETGIFCFAACQSVGCDTPNFCNIISGAILWLLCFDVNVNDVWIGANVLADPQFAAINLNSYIELCYGQQYCNDCNATKRWKSHHTNTLRDQHYTPRTINWISSKLILFNTSSIESNKFFNEFPFSR